MIRRDNWRLKLSIITCKIEIEMLNMSPEVLEQFNYLLVFE